MVIQQALHFSTPAPRLNSTAPKERKRELRRACYRALDCLLECHPGRATRAQLTAWAGPRFSARLCELRPFLLRLTGEDHWSARLDPLPCTQDKATGASWYEIQEWAVPAAREASRRYWLARGARG